MQFACRRKPTFTWRNSVCPVEPFLPTAKATCFLRSQEPKAAKSLLRLRESFFYGSASLRACLRQQGIVIFQQLTARVNSCPDTRLHTRVLFPQTLVLLRSDPLRTEN